MAEMIMMNQNEATNNTATAAATAAARPVCDGIRNAIITLCEAGNPHAITNVEAAASGATPDDFSRWTYYVRLLRNTAIEYGKVADAKDSSEEELELAKGRVWDKWRDIIAVGEEDKFHPNMFVRSCDADTIRVLATGVAHIAVPNIGTVPCATPEKAFRKMVEQFLGCRIRANAALCDADRDLLVNFLGWQKSVEKAKERLNGKETEDGHQAGLREKLDYANAQYQMSIEVLASVGMSEEDINNTPAVAELLVTIDGLEKSIAAQNQTISECNKKIAEKQEQYDRVVATINKIERPATR